MQPGSPLGTVRLALGPLTKKVRFVYSGGQYALFKRSGGALFDVLEIGGGNAALCAALSAREHGAQLELLLESATQ